MPYILQKTTISETKPQSNPRIRSMTLNYGNESIENTIFFDDNHDKNLHYKYNNLKEKLGSTQIALGLTKCDNLYKNLMREVFRYIKLPLEQLKEEEKLATSVRCLVTLMNNLYTKRDIKSMHLALNQLKNICITRQRQSYNNRKERESSIALGVVKLEFAYKKVRFMLKKGSFEAIRRHLIQHHYKIEKLKTLVELVEKWKLTHDFESAAIVFDSLKRNLAFQITKEEFLEKRAWVFGKLCERSRKRALKAGLSAFCKNSYYTNRIIVAVNYTHQFVLRTKRSHLQFGWDQIKSEIWERNQRAVHIANTTFNVLRNYYLKTCSFWFSRMKQRVLEKEIRYRNLLASNNSFVLYALNSLFIREKQNAFGKLKDLTPRLNVSDSFSHRILYSDEVKLRLFGICATLGHILKRQKQTALQKILMSTQHGRNEKTNKLTEAALKKIALVLKNDERRTQREFLLLLKQKAAQMLKFEATERAKQQQEDSQRRFAAHILVKILATARIRYITRAFEDLKNFGIFNIKVRSQLSAISKLSIQLEFIYQSRLRAYFESLKSLSVPKAEVVPKNPMSSSVSSAGLKNSKEVKIFIEDGEQELIFSGQIINSPNFKTVMENQKFNAEQPAQFNPFTSNIPEIKEKNSHSKSNTSPLFLQSKIIIIYIGIDHSFGKDFFEILRG